jgi:hypothetical protein
LPRLIPAISKNFNLLLLKFWEIADLGGWLAQARKGKVPVAMKEEEGEEDELTRRLNALKAPGE